MQCGHFVGIGYFCLAQISLLQLMIIFIPRKKSYFYIFWVKLSFIVALLCALKVYWACMAKPHFLERKKCCICTIFTLGKALLHFGPWMAQHSAFTRQNSFKYLTSMFISWTAHLISAQGTLKFERFNYLISGRHQSRRLIQHLRHFRAPG